MQGDESTVERFRSVSIVVTSAGFPMQTPWLGCNLPLPGDSNRVLVAVDLRERQRHWRVAFSFYLYQGVMKELQSANAVYNVIRMVLPSG